MQQAGLTGQLTHDKVTKYSVAWIFCYLIPGNLLNYSSVHLCWINKLQISYLICVICDLVIFTFRLVQLHVLLLYVSTSILQLNSYMVLLCMVSESNWESAVHTVLTYIYRLMVCIVTECDEMLWHACNIGVNACITLTEHSLKTVPHGPS